jgi:hypothetical protein
MVTEQRFPLCGGEMMDARPVDFHALRLGVWWPNKWLPRASGGRARLCLDCGSVMLFVTDPQRLRQPPT